MKKPNIIRRFVGRMIARAEGIRLAYKYLLLPTLRYEPPMIASCRKLGQARRRKK